MTPFQLTGQTPDGRTATVHACSTCMIVAPSAEVAERCCTCSYCGQPVDKDKYGKRRHEHDACHNSAWAKRDQKRRDKAEKLETWDGPVFWNEQLYMSLDDAVEAMECQLMDDDWPEFVCVAERSLGYHLDAESILQNLQENMPCEDTEDLPDFKGQSEFDAACKAFNEANKDIEWWEEDSKRMVRVPPREATP